jgi:hypothetical protein
MFNFSCHKILTIKLSVPYEPPQQKFVALNVGNAKGSPVMLEASCYMSAPYSQLTRFLQNDNRRL